jgi:hypothetical protein
MQVCTITLFVLIYSLHVEHPYRVFLLHIPSVVRHLSAVNFFDLGESLGVSTGNTPSYANRGKDPT